MTGLKEREECDNPVPLAWGLPSGRKLQVLRALTCSHVVQYRRTLSFNLDLDTLEFLKHTGFDKKRLHCVVLPRARLDVEETDNHREQVLSTQYASIK